MVLTEKFLLNIFISESNLRLAGKDLMKKVKIPLLELPPYSRCAVTLALKER